MIYNSPVFSLAVIRLPGREQWPLLGGVFCSFFWILLPPPGRWSNLTIIFFQMGWNHQLDLSCLHIESRGSLLGPLRMFGLFLQLFPNLEDIIIMFTCWAAVMTKAIQQTWLKWKEMLSCKQKLYKVDPITSFSMKLWSPYYNSRRVISPGKSPLIFGHF